MTKDETLKILTLIEGAYPGFGKDGGKRDIGIVWSRILGKYDFEVCAKAVKHYIENSEHKHFPPVIGDITDVIRQRYYYHHKLANMSGAERNGEAVNLVHMLNASGTPLPGWLLRELDDGGKARLQGKPILELLEERHESNV